MIIQNDTVWKSGERIFLNDTLQIASGASLTIEEDVQVIGGRIEVFGSLNVSGTSDGAVELNGTSIAFGSYGYNSGAVIAINYAKFNGGEFLGSGSGGGGTAKITSSYFKDTDGFYFWYPSSGTFLRQNIFEGTMGLSLSGGVLVENNLFISPRRGYSADGESAITVWNGELTPRGNTFVLSDGQYAFEIPRNYSYAVIDGRSNFFGTTDLGTISRFVLDGRDDLSRPSNVRISDALDAPPSVTPTGPLALRGNASNNSIVGGAGSDTIWGYAGDDQIGGESGNDTLYGGAGNDTLYGGTGIDLLYGGAGNDIYVADGGDTIREAANGGIDTVRSSATHALAANVEYLALTGTAAVNGTGNALDNWIGGNGAANVLNGWLGADTLVGGSGNDTYMTDGGDIIRELVGGGIDTVRSTVTHSLAANVENLILTGAAAINGIGNVLNNALTGNAAANVLNGWTGNDTLSGGAGSDTLMGGAGADRLAGGAGRDVLRSGTGDGATDVFVFNHASETGVGAGRDIIFDFEAGIDDIDLHGIDANQRSAGDQAFAFGGTSARANAVWIAAVDGGALVRGDVNGDRMADFEIMLSGVKQIGAADFLL